MRTLLPIFFFVILLLPKIGYPQLSDSLLNKVRTATSDFFIQPDTLKMAGSKTLPCLEVLINGKGPYIFLVDLGSNVMLFKQSVVEATNTKIVVDRTRGDIVNVNKFQIGNSLFLNVHGAAYEDLDVDGVIGYNLLSKSNFYLDYPEMRFAFIIENTHSPDSGFTSIHTIGRMPYLRSRIEEKDYYMNFDTGATLWLYFPLHLKDSIKLSAPLREFKKMHNNQTGTTMTYIGQLQSDVPFGPYTIKAPFVVFDPNIEDIYVGSSLLSQFKLIFYPEQGLVKMIRNSGNLLLSIPADQKRVSDH